MFRRAHALHRSLAGVAVLLAVRATPAIGQKTPEFLRQNLLIPVFGITPGIDKELGEKAADVVRGRTDRLSNHREVEVLDWGDVVGGLARAGFRTDTALDESTVRATGRGARADEYLLGDVGHSSSGGASGIKLSATLVLMRDPKLRQPLPRATGARLDDAADQLARALVAARSQLVSMRRCENALRDNKAALAVTAAQEGVAAYPASTLARTCLLWALQAAGAPAPQILETAHQVLGIDSTSYYALNSAAAALDTLRRHDEAGRYWLRLAETDTSDLELTQRVLWSLTAGGNWQRAESLAVRASEAHPENPLLVRHKWRTAFENRHWKTALAAGELMLRGDTAAFTDPVFFQRLATAYRADGQSARSIEVAARGVATFPTEPKLYALYAQYIREEADTVIGRGLTRFPKSAELLALNAKALRAKGKVAESLDAMQSAVAADSSLGADAQLVIAQTHLDLGHADSALGTLRSALARGRDSTRVAQFAFARGNALYRAANGSKSSGAFSTALGFLTLADSVRPSAQSQFLVGAAALGIVQTALAEAAADTDKTHRCTLMQLGADMIPLAKTGMAAGQEMMPEAVKQSMEYLAQAEPYALKQVATYCGPRPTGASAGASAGVSRPPTPGDGAAPTKGTAPQP